EESVSMGGDFVFEIHRIFVREKISQGVNSEAEKRNECAEIGVEENQRRAERNQREGRIEGSVSNPHPRSFVSAHRHPIFHLCTELEEISRALKSPSERRSIRADPRLKIGGKLPLDESEHERERNQDHHDKRDERDEHRHENRYAPVDSE